MAANLDFNLILVHGFADVTVTELHFYNRNCVSVLETAFRNKKTAFYILEVAFHIGNTGEQYRLP